VAVVELLVMVQVLMLVQHLNLFIQLTHLQQDQQLVVTLPVVDMVVNPVIQELVELVVEEILSVVQQQEQV
jgi:hypothetical protein